MEDGKAFDLTTQKILLNFFSLLPTNNDSSYEKLQNNSIRCDSIDSTPKSSLNEGATGGLTLIKKKDKVLMFRPSSTPSSARSSSHSQNGQRAYSSQPVMKTQSNVFFDSIDGRKDDSISSDLTTLEEMQAAHTYVDIFQEEVLETEELCKEIKNIQKEIQEEEIKKRQCTLVERDAGRRMDTMFDSPMDYHDGGGDHSSRVDAESVASEVGLRLRVVGDQVERQFHDEITSAVDGLVRRLNEGSTEFETYFHTTVQNLLSLVGSGWQAVALIFTLSQRVVMACGWSLRMMMDVACRAIRQHEGAFIEEQGGWEVVNSMDIEFLGSSVDTPPSIPH